MKKAVASSLMMLALLLGVCGKAHADTSEGLCHQSEKALHRLYEQNPKARVLGKKAVAVLIFPIVLKGGFLVGVQCGNGVLLRNGQVAGYYNITSASYGFQAGVQKLSYALFFMDKDSLKYLKKSEGFDLGSAPSLVVADQGVSGSMSIASMQNGIATFIFGQKGLMGGISLQGTKITRYTPDE